MRLAGLRASFYLFDGAWSRVMRSPTVWHDRTPVCKRIGIQADLRLVGLSVDCPKVSWEDCGSTDGQTLR